MLHCARAARELTGAGSGGSDVFLSIARGARRLRGAVSVSDAPSNTMAEGGFCARPQPAMKSNSERVVLIVHRPIGWRTVTMIVGLGTDNPVGSINTTGMILGSSAGTI